MIEQTHPNQNPVNVALLKYVEEANKTRPASYAELFAAFADLQSSEVKARVRFNKKLEYLCFTEQLSSTGRGQTRLFVLGPEAGKPGRSRGYADRSQRRVKSELVAVAKFATPAALAAVDNDPAVIDPHSPLGIALRHAADRDAQRARPVPAPSYNHMQAPVYVPPRSSAGLRPGAMDYQRYASYGDRC